MSTRSAGTVAAALAEGAALQGEGTFLVVETAPGEQQRISWAEMDARATRTARLLRSLGLQTGDRLNVHATNCAEFYDLWFGAARLGAVIVPSDPLHTPDELAYLLARSRCHLTFTHASLRETTARARLQAHDCRHLFVIGGDGDDAFHTARDAQSDAPWSPEEDGAGPGPHDTLGVLHVTAEAGRHEEVLITHDAYLGAGRSVAARLRMRPDDRQLVVLPLFRGNAQQYASMSALVSGASIALAPGFSATRWPSQARSLGATLAGLLPAPICMLLAREEGGDDDAHRLRAVVATQKVSEEQIASFEKRFHVSLLQLYGMRETVAPVPAPAQARRRKREQRGPARARRPGAAGRPRPEGPPRGTASRLSRPAQLTCRQYSSAGEPSAPEAPGGDAPMACTRPVTVRRAGPPRPTGTGRPPGGRRTAAERARERSVVWSRRRVSGADALSSLCVAGCRRPLIEHAEAE
ncbi:AMP-binding protein [Streptomyces pinistramenti]|uniref:AMP-binding protein n=1 Tax=Streptomyces pinistramenti TaxID=2884812 RepID=UPI001D07F723|nr:AMP-binding protein [Streptomyces pinistramenti]MCB5906098.1 AMP-binding protein [Streptomyces pinistramenti]